MRNAETILPNVTGAVRWIARISGLILVVCFVWLYIDEGRGITLSDIKLNEKIMIVSFISAALGLLIAWLWEGLGGLITIIGLLAFSFAYYHAGYGFLWSIWVLAIPALLFIFYWWRTS